LGMVIWPFDVTLAASSISQRQASTNPQRDDTLRELAEAPP
jgi:hypothetical protein